MSKIIRKSKSKYVAYKYFKNIFNVNNFDMRINHNGDVIFSKYVKEISLTELGDFLININNVKSFSYKNPSLDTFRDIPLTSKILEDEIISIYFKNRRSLTLRLSELYVQTWFISKVNSYKEHIKRYVSFAKYLPEKKRIEYDQSKINLANYTHIDKISEKTISNTNYNCSLTC